MVCCIYLINFTSNKSSPVCISFHVICLNITDIPWRYWHINKLWSKNDQPHKHYAPFSWLITHNLIKPTLTYLIKIIIAVITSNIYCYRTLHIQPYLIGTYKSIICGIYLLSCTDKLNLGVMSIFTVFRLQEFCTPSKRFFLQNLQFVFRSQSTVSMLYGLYFRLKFTCNPLGITK